MWEVLCDTSITIQRATISQDALAGTTRTWANLLTGVQCAFQSANSREAQDYSLRGIACESIIYSVYDFDSNVTGGIRIGDRVIDPDGIYWAVTFVRKDKNLVLSYEPLYEIAVERYKSQPN